MAMAGYGNISATAFMIKKGGILNTLNTNAREKPKNISDEVCNKKIYIPTYVGKYRIIGCVDSGSDITILQLRQYDRIFKNRSHIKKGDIQHITTYCDNTVPVLGVIHARVQLSQKHPGIKLCIYIVQDIPNVPAFLLGNDMLKAGLGMIAYTGEVKNPYPEVIFSIPTVYKCSVFYETPEEAMTCTAHVTLGPLEVADVQFYLSQAAQVLRTDYILITGQCWDTVNIIPSRSDIEFVPMLEKYVANGCVANLSNKTITCTIVGRFELVNDCRVVSLNEPDKGTLRSALIDYPVGRELLLSKADAKSSIPTLSVCHVSMSEDPSYKVSDLDFADTIMHKEPTYSGEAEIKPEIIEPTGLDLPTIIYKNANEAIDLTSYSEELRPYIKEIFLEKYPQVVALHSLDAGNLSLTLGFTQLRLREGENLPRSKRIFHVSPTDQRHLDDLCDFLIKFGFIMRSPMSPNGCHLYGMSAYLVPRSKINCLGRLIIDYSPVNQLIQSPSSVIPEINATIQFLQGKALYTSLDLKYAYLSLRIDEESRKLTTFLTPTGSFQWLSLPTGAANSPAYFTDA
ncbi:MAG: hypothetical protein RR063_10370 [Anaerovoracaceae bacterium]